MRTCSSVLCICFLRIADAVQCLADMEHEPASGPQSPIVAAALAWLGLVLHPCGSSGWPAGCSPQIACSLGTGPLGSCQSKSTGAGWAQSISAGTLKNLLIFTLVGLELEGKAFGVGEEE